MDVRISLTQTYKSSDQVWLGEISGISERGRGNGLGDSNADEDKRSATHPEKRRIPNKRVMQRNVTI